MPTHEQTSKALQAVEFIREHPGLTAEQIAIRLNRPANTIYSIAKNHGLTIKMKKASVRKTRKKVEYNKEFFDEREYLKTFP
ncbi:MAG: hypothetical protein JST87_05420 [Bacteroidetes bacterium]|nr:hypothetical protein [Bacteroidota bacterium]